MGQDDFDSDSMKDADPQMAKLLGAMAIAASSRPHPSTLSVEDQRQRFSSDMAFWNLEGPVLPRVENGYVRGAVGELAYRLYDPADRAGLRPALIYFHGGGWCLGDLDAEDRQLRELAFESGVIVFSLAYRLAPEHKYPAALEDCVAVLRHLSRYGADYGIDPHRLAIGGLSAGANLALATALHCRDEGETLVRFLLLLQGGYGAENTESHRLYGGGTFGLDLRNIENYYGFYLKEARARTLPGVSPLVADLRDLPPVFLNAAGLDPLRDDSLQLADRFRQAGVAVDLRVYPGVIHVFTLMLRRLDAARLAVRDAADALRSALL